MIGFVDPRGVEPPRTFVHQPTKNNILIAATTVISIQLILNLEGSVADIVEAVVQVAVLKLLSPQEQYLTTQTQWLLKLHFRTQQLFLIQLLPAVQVVVPAAVQVVVVAVEINFNKK